MRGGDPFIYKSPSNDVLRSPLDLTDENASSQLPSTHINAGGWGITINAMKSQLLLYSCKYRDDLEIRLV